MRENEGNPAEQKRKRRILARKRRAALTDSQRREREERILELFLASDGYLGCERILTYVSFRDEVSTHELIRRALRDGKRVFCPRTEPLERGGGMEFYEIRSFEELRPGYQGILEPAPDPGQRWPEAAANEDGKDGPVSERCRADLMVLPGAAFDRRGCRLGFGGGYYDRFLAGRKGLSTLALAFSCQIEEELPEEDGDIRVQRILTEKGEISCCSPAGSNGR